MFKYIKNELQKVSKRKATWITAIVIVVVCLLANLAVMAFTLIYGSDRDGVLGSNVLAFASWVFVIPYYACVFFADLVFGPSYPNPLIKDKFTKNLSRTKIFLGSLVSAFVLSLCFMVVAFVCLLLTTRLFHSDITTYDIQLFVENMLVATPLWMAGVAIGMCVLFIFEDKKWAYITYFIITLLIPRFIMFFAAEPFSFGPAILVRKGLMTQSFGHIPYPADPNRDVPFIVAEGLIYCVIATIIGIIVYNKKDFTKKGKEVDG